MKKILLIIFVFSFMACTSNKEKKEVFIFNKISFKLIENEKVVNTKHKIIEDYKSYFVDNSIQIPLLKCIKSEGYTIYIGIPYNTSIDKLTQMQILGVKPIKSETDTLTYLFNEKKKGSSYITELSKDFDNNLIYVLAVTNSKTISDSIFNKTNLLDRFTYTKK